ncbi:uncharacterized protein LOC144769033 [Lissotriton helveticus]
MAENISEDPLVRKRKVKFSEQELEILIEEVTAHNDQLFGKLSLKVPEGVKRKIWLAIQSKVNTVGVAHRDINNLQKRWYDLRSRAKEKIATRTKSAKKTGGGTPRDRPNTPLEDLIEGTLTTEAVIGVIDIDTSDQAGPSQDAEVATDFIEYAESFTQNLLESAEMNSGSTSPTVQPTTSQRRVRHIQESDSEEAPNVTVENQNLSESQAPVQRQLGRRQRIQPFVRRRARSSFHQSATDGDTSASEVELKLLKVQRLQGKDIRVIKGKFNQVTKDISVISKTLSHMTKIFEKAHSESSNKLGRMAVAMEAMCNIMQSQQIANAKRCIRSMLSNQACCRSMNMMCRTNAQLIKPVLDMQKDVSQCCGDITRGMNALETIANDRQKSTSNSLYANHVLRHALQVTSNSCGMGKLFKAKPELRIPIDGVLVRPQQVKKRITRQHQEAI